MNLQDHIEYIRNRCIDAIAHGDEMNSAIFEDGHGLIMTFNEAIEIVNHIDRLKAQREQLEKEKAELLSVLSDLLDEQNGPPIWSRANEWQAVCDKARMLIENAEKKEIMKFNTDKLSSI